MHLDTSTYDLNVQPPQTNPGQESMTFTPTGVWTVATGAPMTVPLTSLESLWWETFTDPENGLGRHKGDFDNFGGRFVPAPGAVALPGLGVLAASRRRR